MRSTRPTPQRERGAALIEFALVIPFLILLSFAVVDLGRAFFVKNVLYQAAREGVRTAAVMTGADGSTVDTRVRQVAAAANVPITSVVVSAPVDQQVSVTVQSTFNWLYPGLFNWVGSGFVQGNKLTATAWMRKETP